MSFNEREGLFEMELTEYEDLDQIKREFEPISRLWSIASLFHTSHTVWMTGPFIELDPVKMESDVTSWWKAMYKLEKLLSEKAPEPAKVATEMKEAIAKFKLHIPIISNLRNPGLRSRHWDALSDVVGQGIVPDVSLTWSQLLSLDVHDHREEIEKICMYADKEYGLEQALDRMEDDWKALDIPIVPHKNTGTFKIVEIDDILMLLDDHIIKTQTMRGSPYIKAFDARVRKWEARLMLVSNIIDEWLVRFLFMSYSIRPMIFILM